jgi:hypothetical protein
MGSGKPLFKEFFVETGRMAAPSGLGPRISQLLKQIYPRDRAKLIARRFKVSESTAERWLRGHAPTTHYIEEMYAEWGIRFVQAVFIEAFQNEDPRIAALEAGYRQKQNSDESLVQSVPSDQKYGSRQPEYSARILPNPLIESLIASMPPETFLSRLARTLGFSRI